jgi:threonine aldolase
MRFLAAPWVGMLQDGAWLRHARHANAMARLLEAAFREVPWAQVLRPAQVNSVFVEMPPECAQALRERGWMFYSFIGQSGSRFMCSWDTTPEDIEALSADLAAV